MKISKREYEKITRHAPFCIEKGNKNKIIFKHFSIQDFKKIKEAVTLNKQEDWENFITSFLKKNEHIVTALNDFVIYSEYSGKVYNRAIIFTGIKNPREFSKQRRSK